MNVKVKFENYKAIESLDAEFASGNIYFIKGPNSKGKTSVLQGLLSTVKGKNPNDMPVTLGKQEGHITTQIIGADGKNYTVKFEFADGKNDKFLLVQPNGTTSNKVTDIEKIFKFNAFTVEEFFSWGTSAEGRRKQADIIKKMLDKVLVEELDSIHSKINDRNGTVYIDRRDANVVLDSMTKALAGYNLDEKEKTMIEQYSDYDDQVMALQEKRDKILQDRAKYSDVFAAIGKKEGELLSLQAQRNSHLEELDRIKARVTELEGLLSGNDEEQRSVSKQLDELKSKVKTEEGEDPDKLSEQIETMKPFVTILNTARAKTKQKEEAEHKLEEQRKKVTVLDDDITALRARRQEIIATANIPIKNIELDGDELVYVDGDNRFPFTETNLSYAKGGLVVAEIMLHVNKELPIVLVGKAAEYDKKSLSRLYEMAQANDAIMLLDKVIEDDHELVIECYEPGSQPEIKGPVKESVTSDLKIKTSEILKEQPFKL